MSPPVEFIKIGHKLWYDLNLDGRIDSKGDSPTSEIIALKKGKEETFLAQSYLSTHLAPMGLASQDLDALRLDALRLTVKIIPVKNLKSYFDSPIKQTLKQELSQEINQLQKLKTKDPFYKSLLLDLKAIREELDYVRFEEVEQLPDSNQRAAYDLLGNIIRYQKGCSVDILIHEMAHVVLHKKEGLKNPAFTVTLDYPSNEQTPLTYRDSVMVNFSYAEKYDSSPPCTNPLILDSAIARETYAYQVQVRYLLYKGGFDPRVNDPTATPNIKLLVNNFYQTINTKNTTNPSLVHQEYYEAMVTAYFSGSGESPLNQWVKTIYTEAHQSGFVDAENCSS